MPGDGEGFCGTLAAGVFEGGTYASLAIGSQKSFDEDDGQEHVYPGTVHVLAGSKSGLNVDGIQLWPLSCLISNCRSLLGLGEQG